ncbi:MAG: hypothetical protein KCCBMMGE_00389 [Candidatus Methanoperedenaceae archaeon GB37]|nr:MAG: hypothetical protein KCCBMMGE_00389 [Candidatus Methanoperedenaceae archaeon GB37]
MNLYQIIGKWAFSASFLGKRMCFLTGPRQIGKTTLSLLHLKSLRQEKNYYNWDTLGVKKLYAENPLFFLENLPEIPPPPAPNLMPKYWIVFDEFHKHPNWKNLLKGYYDEFGHFLRFVVCGSARLDLFRLTGESLLGRYFLFKMFPLGPRDITEGGNFSLKHCWYPENTLNITLPSSDFKEAVETLFRLSGFPEPFLMGRAEFYNRWKEEHISLLTTEEIRDLSKISDLVRLQTLVFLLPERVGAPVSLNKLAHILECAYNTVKTWIEALEKVYLFFRISPFMGKISRSLKKEKKLYFWDWGILSEGGKRFENFIAVQLIRTLSAWNEWGWGRFELYYVRTKEGKEVDFLVVKNGKPFMLIETKLSEVNLDPSLLYFKKRLNAPYAFQVIYHPDFLKQVTPGIFVIDASRFLYLLA